MHPHQPHDPPAQPFHARDPHRIVLDFTVLHLGAAPDRWAWTTP